jgi:hypothetical protein
MTKRDKLSAEIFRTVPLPQVIAAAAHMYGRLGEVSMDELADFIERLDVAGLKELRRIALTIEGGVEQ